MANYVLEILDGDRAGEVLPVGDATVRIGRKSGNDIVLADEKTSGVHCEIAKEGDRLVLKDLGSTNGTFLDGKRISEIVLTPGDVVTVGRLRVRFMDADSGAAAADDDAGELSLGRLDASRLQRSGRPVGLLLVVVVLLAAGGGWFWWQGRGGGAGGGGIAGGPMPRSRAPLQVSGNRLPDEIGACEDESGYDLRAGGLGFAAIAQAHTGSGAFGAVRAEDAAADFAILQLAQPLEVFAGRTMTLTAHAATSGGGLVALRAVAFAAAESEPFRYCSGTAMAPAESGWQQLSTSVTVPVSCDRLQLEVVAVLPTTAAEVRVDDIAVIDGGDANGVSVAGAEQTLLGFGAALAVRSIHQDDPGTVLAFEPVRVTPALAGLAAAGRCVLSDLGATIGGRVEQDELVVEATGVDALALVLSPDAVGDLRISSEAEGGFESSAAEATFEARRVLFGSHATRAMLVADEPVACVGAAAHSRYRLSVAAPGCRLASGFRAERQRAVTLVAQARLEAAEGRPRAALDAIAELLRTVPMDSEQLALAQQLRGELLGEQARQFAALQSDFEQAGFFNTRGGFERVRAGLDELVARYGEHNVEGLEAVRALRSRADERLAAIDRRDHAGERERLQALAAAFEAASQKGLADLVRGYVEEHLGN